MKKYSTLSAVLFIFIFTISISCKKEKTDEEPDPVGYYMKFKVDGVQKQFTYTDGMKFRSNYSGNMMYVEAREDIDIYPQIQFDFSNTKKIFNKDFVFTNRVSSDTLGYMIYNEGNAYIHNFRTLDATGSKLGNTDFVFSLTDRTETHVRGTFSGTVYNFIGSVQSMKKITEGKFYLIIGSQ